MPTSREKALKGLGGPAQPRDRDPRASAKRAGHKVVAVFKEIASSADDGRPERAKVLALARANKIDPMGPQHAGPRPDVGRSPGLGK